MIPRIFIGGTGRSGTWLLYKILGSHEDIHTFPAELRFIVDPGGLLELTNALTDNYSPTLAREALFRFERLMRVYLATYGKAPYAAIDLPEWLGRDFYWQRLDQFCSHLVEIEHEAFYWNHETTDNGRVMQLRKKFQGFLRGENQKQVENYSRSSNTLSREAKYYSNRSELINLASKFVEDILIGAANSNGKTTWCEKTPQHLLHLDFIWELFPDSFFVHIKRDPRGVIYSLSKQPWGPRTIPDACKFIKGVYERWFDLKSTLDFSSRRYFELKLEDLAEAPEEFLERMAIIGEFDARFQNPPEIIRSKVDYWKNEMSIEELTHINENLGNYIEQLGYGL
jgi:hypothetical protein